MHKINLPMEVQKNADAAERAIEQIISDRELNPRRGPPRLPPIKKHLAVIMGDTEIDLERRLEKLECILGPRTRGNRRWGRTGLYADLMREFERLQQLGITLPGNKHLSARACMHGLGDVLRKHSHTNRSDSVLMRSSRERVRIAKKLDSAFTQVRKYLQ
jgi:hypothetical protein